MRTILKMAGSISIAALAAMCWGAAASPNALQSQARVTESQARGVALAKVPGGSVKSHELEEEGGRLVWTYDIARPGVKGVTEIHVDAKTGKIVSIKNETPAQEAKEARGEKQPQH